MPYGHLPWQVNFQERRAVSRRKKKLFRLFTTIFQKLLQNLRHISFQPRNTLNTQKKRDLLFRVFRVFRGFETSTSDSFVDVPNVSRLRNAQENLGSKFSKIPLAFCRQVLLQYQHDVSRKAGVAAMRGMFFALSDGSDPVTYVSERSR